MKQLSKGIDHKWNNSLVLVKQTIIIAVRRKRYTLLCKLRWGLQNPPFYFITVYIVRTLLI